MQAFSQRPFARHWQAARGSCSVVVKSTSLEAECTTFESVSWTCGAKLQSRGTSKSRGLQITDTVSLETTKKTVTYVYRI